MPDINNQHIVRAHTVLEKYKKMHSFPNAIAFEGSLLIELAKALRQAVREARKEALLEAAAVAMMHANVCSRFAADRMGYGAVASKIIAGQLRTKADQDRRG